MELYYIDLYTTDPSFNLATEEYIFDHLPKDKTYLMLWQNDNAVIIGKHQNTLAEIDLSYVEANNIKVVRRLSGGGAVYHDLGNLNFSFISNAEKDNQLDFKTFCKPIIEVLNSIGIDASLNGRNDMTIDGKKFSGNSQYIKNGRVMHHGTILFQSNLDVLNAALKTDPDKIQAKGIKSVRSRVTNVFDHLKEPLSLAQFRTLIIKSLIKHTVCKEYRLTQQDIESIIELQKNRYNTWDWNFGASPSCTIHKKARIEGCGTVEIYLTVDSGIITNVEFRGDFFSLQDISLLSRKLIGCKPIESDYIAALKNIQTSDYIANLPTNIFIQILVQ